MNLPEHSFFTKITARAVASTHLPLGVCTFLTKNRDKSPGNPYQTIGQALSVTDGPSVGQEDIICFSGIANESQLSDFEDGKSTTYTLEGIPVPQDPFMIVGWDKDNDGIYPPYDNDDIAIIDGTLEASSEAFMFLAASGAKQ